jgi:hypothetical protein
MRCGLIDHSGSWVLTPEFSGLAWHPGPVEATKRGKERVILDLTQPKVAVNTLSHRGMLTNWDRGVAGFTDGRGPFRLIGADGQFRGNKRFDELKFERSIVEPPFERSKRLKIKEFSAEDDRIPACQNGQCGYVDLSGIWAIEPVFSEVQPFAERRACVASGSSWSLINPEGNVVIDRLAACHGPPHESVIWVQRNPTGTERGGEPLGGWELLDLDGNSMIRLNDRLSRAHPFIEGRAVVQPTGRDPTYMRRDGTLLEIPVGVECFWSHSEGLALFLANGKTTAGFMDLEGDVVIEPRFNVPDRRLAERMHAAEGKAALMEGDLWGYLDINSKKWAIEPKFELAGPFRSNTAVVTLAGRTFHIDHHGREIKPR